MLLLDKLHDYKNRAFEITGLENVSFEKVTSLFNDANNNPIRYKNESPVRFLKFKKRDGMEKEMMIVMVLIYFLPRFQKEPKISEFYQNLTGKKPTDLKTIIGTEKKI